MALKQNFDKRAIFDGLKTKDRLSETPDTFGTRNSVAQQSNSKNLSQNGNRMAVDRIRNETLKNNPEEDQATIEWMKAYSFSPLANEPGGWNESKNNGMNPYINAGEGGTNDPSNMEDMDTGSDSGMEEA